ncbi:DoxX family protein [Aestuariibaculum lutulentum]|uniref:DoxX family protein n=1 Tax=Aestuariibaculum lutulentum TaxID=2920935 RepID=A0ABS9RNR3_9FLAO|nr:DoxX family protein [Aestuariibaculum lutulentum]MCH4553782.1 DoxX family protein [Aestuariibaculum lutulentum]
MRINYFRYLNITIIKAFLRLAISSAFLSTVVDRFGFKTEFRAKLSGILILTFALSMTFSTGIKGAFDFSVFTASAAAFALKNIKEKRWELDSLLQD